MDGRAIVTQLYFIALLPPVDLQREIRSLQEEIAQRFETTASLKSPPHITLIPPIRLTPEQQTALPSLLETFAAQAIAFPVQLQDFAVFAPRVLYIDVVATPALVTLQAALKKHLQQHSYLKAALAQGRTYPFVPHLTLGFRDLSVENFHRAWAEFQQRSFQGTFQARSLTLLRHPGQGWRVEQDFCFAPMDSDRHRSFDP